jgi:DNA-binding XRE family transcriptional regulator
MTPDKIKAARAALGLTQTKFGELLHANFKTVQAWEAGTRNMQAVTTELLKTKLREKKMSKSLLTARITIDHEDKNTPVYSFINLYKEENELVWRLDGPYGDECETLPKPKNLEQAKQDFRDTYKDSAWCPKANWL